MHDESKWSPLAHTRLFMFAAVLHICEQWRPNWLLYDLNILFVNCDNFHHIVSSQAQSIWNVLPNLTVAQDGKTRISLRKHSSPHACELLLHLLRHLSIPGLRSSSSPFKPRFTSSARVLTMFANRDILFSIRHHLSKLLPAREGDINVLFLQYFSWLKFVRFTTHSFLLSWSLFMYICIYYVYITCSDSSRDEGEQREKIFSVESKWLGRKHI